MEYEVFMKCGHVANARTDDDTPVCLICAPKKEAFEIVGTPDLTGRKAVCDMCNRKVDSNMKLPFFEYRPDEEYDKYYCGCRGWD